LVLNNTAIEKLIWHNVQNGEEFEIHDVFFDKRDNEFLVIGNPYPKREGPSLSDIIDANPEKYRILCNMICRCDICESGRSCSGPVRPLKEIDLAELDRFAPRDGGPCGGCGKYVQYFKVVINGYRCPECNGPESNINWHPHIEDKQKEKA